MRRPTPHPCFPPFPTGFAVSLSLLTALGVSGVSEARGQTAPAPPPAAAPASQQPAQAVPPSGELPPTAPPAGQSPPTSAPPAAGRGNGVRISTPNITFQADQQQINPASGEISASGNVEVRFSDAIITSDRVEGNLNREVIFSGNAKIVTQGATSYADAIHVFPGSRSFRLDNPRGVLTPEFLREQITEPLYLTGGDLAGTTLGYFIADQFIATTCREHFHHYEFRIGNAELYPHEKLILRKVSVYFFGQKIITIPYLLIPLDLRTQRQRRPRTDYLPEIGQNSIEGYYARFPYSFVEGAAAATFLRLDVTQKRGEGGRIEQEYLAGKQDSAFNTSYAGPQNGGFTGATSGTIATAYGYGGAGRLPNLGTGLGPQNGGLFTMQGYFNDGFNRDFNASFRHQQGLGSNNRIAFDTELQRNSALIGSAQTNQTTRFNFDHADAAHGVNAGLAINVNNTSSNFSGSDFSSSQITGNFHQSFDFAGSGVNRNTLNYSLDLFRSVSNTSSADTTTFSRSERLDTQFQFQHSAREYNYSLQANKTTPIGVQTNNTAFGSLEKLPEVQFSSDTYNFKGGFLHQLPLRFDIGAGRYSEPAQNVQDDRITLGLTVQDFTVLKGRTEVTTGGGFEQRLYGDGAAQYIIRDSTRLRQHLGGRSGFDLRYDYSQPEGGTPFQFDTFGRSHSLTAEGGYLDDRHFQATARVGYDFLGTSSQAPFQSLTTRIMWRPTPSFRFDLLSTYDPNTGKFFSFTNRLAFRAPGDFAIDVVSRIDPQQPGIRRKFSQINTQFQSPLGRTWHMSGLVRYNGATNKFESINFQLVHEWDCLEASVTYTQNPFGFRNDQQLFLTLRIKGLPFFRSFARGPAGETIGVGLGDLN